MGDGVRKYAKVILNIIFPAACIGFAVCILPRLLIYFMPFVIGWILAMMANPLVRFLERRMKLVRKHSSMLIVVLALAVVIGLIYLIVSRAIVLAAGFIRDLPQMYDLILAELREAMANFERIFVRISPEQQQSLDQLGSRIEEYLTIAVQNIAPPTVSAAGNVAKRIPAALVYTVITILSAYFFIVERDRIIQFWKKYVPESGLRYCEFLKQTIRRLVYGYFLAQFRIMFVVAAILAAGFLILGVRYSVLWAVLIALLDFLPIFGTGTALGPWAVVKILSGEYAFAAGLILLYILTQVVRQVIQPKIVGDTIGMPPLLTLVCLYIGFRVAGIGGMILAVPVGMFIVNLYQFGAFDSMIENIKILIRGIQTFRKK